MWESIKDLQEGRAGGGAKAKGGGGGGDDGGKWKMSFFDRGPQMAVTPDGLKTQSRHPKVCPTTYRKMMINQDTACMFACCYGDKEGHLTAHLS